MPEGPRRRERVATEESTRAKSANLQEIFRPLARPPCRTENPPAAVSQARLPRPAGPQARRRPDSMEKRRRIARLPPKLRLGTHGRPKPWDRMEEPLRKK